MSQTHEYFSMQGKVALGLRNPDGTRKPAQWVFDASNLEWDFTVETDEKNESWSGARGLAGELEKSKKMSVKLTLGELNDSNAAIAMAGTTVQVTGGSVTDEDIGDVKAGDMVALNYALVSALTLSGTAPAAPVVDIDFTVNLNTGVMTFLTDCTGVKGDYTYAAHSIVTALTGNRPDMYVLFDGKNTVKGAQGLALGEVYRITFNPASAVNLISDSFGQLELEGAARIDPVRAADSKYGGYARLKLIDTPVVP